MMIRDMNMAHDLASASYVTHIEPVEASVQGFFSTWDEPYIFWRTKDETGLSLLTLAMNSCARA